MATAPPAAFITAAGSFLPGPPVANDEIDAVLGPVDHESAHIGEVVLGLNGITTRHYARSNGRQTHLNEELAALAVTDALERRGFGVGELGMLATATTGPDLAIPGFASMVHGRLGGGPMEVLATTGVCASGAAALKAVANAVAAGDHERAVVVASELPSVMLKGERFVHEARRARGRGRVAPGYDYFNAEFLRWILSDGAGAAVVERQPRPDGPSLRVDWVSLTSYAHENPVCMFMGTSEPAAPAVGNTWLSQASMAEAEAAGMLVIRQDTDLLASRLVPVGIEELRRLIKVGRVDPDLGYEWFLPHLSSFFFADKVVAGLAEAGLPIPEDRWFTNLATRGNTGSASIFVMLADALAAGLFLPGQRILALVPESGRFTMSFMQFTVVGPDDATGPEDR